MTEWKKSKLNDIIDTLIDYRGKTPNKKTYGVPLITAKIVKNGTIETPNEFIAEEEYESWMTRGIPKKGDMVLTTEAPLGEVALINDEHIALAQRIILLRGKTGILDTTYLKYYFQSPKGHQTLLNRETGTTVTGIKQSELRKVEIEYPPLPTQKKIAEVLSCLDAKIELNRRINENLEQQAQAIFKEWFVDNAKPEWKVGKLGNIIEVKYGKDHKKLSEGTIPVFGSGGIMRYVDKSLYDKESVLIPRKGTLNNIIYVNKPFWSVDTMFYSQMKKANVAKFVYFYLKSLDLASMNAGSAVPSMTTEILNRLEFKMPDDLTLQKYDNITTSLFAGINKNNKENETLIQIRDSLLPKLMNGELEV